MRTGAIVAGGRSTRFGDTDKSVAPLAGVPMVRRVANRLAGDDDPIPPGADRASGGDPVVDELVVNCRPDQRAAIATALDDARLPIRWSLDDETDQGPMAGIRNACRAARGEYAFVVACDMPFVDPAFVSHLFAEATGHDAAVPQLADRWYQTTQAVYNADAMGDACDRALARGDRKILDPLSELEYAVVGDDAIRERTTERTFANVNTREELDDTEAFIRSALSPT
ncbi:molybdenum cofactor guanylyltransferase [Halorubrum sp. DTA98]|uniref:molybdenum cofactor guanylyltransferase n=1 Tax=Halorubrum sp. DTA98 TaxID=3402163 RepID=UPI003AB0F6B2